ncbi:MAG: TolC family protein [Bacteroidota bacterium]
MRNKKFFFLALVTIVRFSGFAQTKTIIGLKVAIDSALYNYPELKAKQFQVESATASVTDAENQVLPSLTFSDQVDLGTDNGVGGSYFPMSIIPSTSGGIRTDNIANTFSGNIGVAYLQHELYNFGLNGARIQSANSLVNFSKADYAESSYLLQFHIAQLYFELLRLRLLVTIQQRNIDRYRVLYDYIKAYTSSGIKPSVDSSIAKAEVSEATIQYIQTAETYNKFKKEFIYYTGLTVNDFDLDTTIYYLPEPRVNQLQDSISSEMVNSSNPVIAYYNNRWEYSLSQENLIEKSYLPKLYLVGSAWIRGSSISPKDTFGNLSTGLDYNRNNYMVGLALTYNIVDLIHQNDKVAIQRYQSESYREDVVQQQYLLENQLRQADIAIGAALATEKEVPLQLRAAQDAFAQKSAQYNAGLANITELTEASYLLYKAETDEVEASSNLLNTLLQKSVTNNTLNTFLANF